MHRFLRGLVLWCTSESAWLREGVRQGKGNGEGYSVRAKVGVRSCATVEVVPFFV